MNPTLNAFGWQFHDDGVTVSVVVDGAKRQIFIPVRQLWVTFGREMAAVGSPMVGVGDFSVGGWWSSLKRSVRRVAKKASRAVKAAVKKVHAVAKKTYQTVLKPALSVARAVVNNPWVRRGIQLASVAIPALAPIGLGLEAAHQALKVVDDGVKAARRVANAVQTGARVLSGDRQAISQALGAQKAMAGVVQLARQGNPAAQRQIGAFRMISGGRPANANAYANSFASRFAQRAA